jgi:hypothetical protein
MTSPTFKSIAGYLVFAGVLYSMLISYGCSNGSGEPGEGRIVYSVTVEGEDVDPMMKAMMPSEITTYYKGHLSATIISMGMGMMETRMISNATERKYTTLISAMGKKIAMVLDGKQVEASFSDRVPLKVRYTDEVKEIAGIKCHQALVTDSTDNSYTVYYTEQLGKSDYNWSTPFKDIKGMMMDYTIRFDNVIMKLTAKEVIHEPNDSSLFQVPEGYEVITDPAQMQMMF